MHLSLRRTLPALAALGIAVGAPLLTAGTAHAVGERLCGDTSVQYSVDGGKTWVDNGRMSEPHGVIQVRLAGDAGEGCDYKISLASYDTEGPTWATSGKQTFLGWATTTLNHEKRQATLDIAADLPKCFGQIDLYNGDKKFDGVANPAPKYPNGVFPDNLIAAWNGGKACAPTPTGTPTVPVPTSSASPTATATPHPTPSASATATATATPSSTAKPSASPTTTGTPSATPSHAATPTSPAPSTSADTTGPVGKPTAKPVSTTPAQTLASTGGNSTQLIAYAAGGAALLAIGAGALVTARRRAARR
ncbi:hypothetical protein [Kitasatospora aureofaciens]|uniref:hypothetical protein n=1 Tax=Kitasatospora aureofaciens TaxID=1894 RepID=UPI001C4952CC|nr:hypothetical protein [Kitasatospora aureofaciens]MBV6697691.1 hypothetical protein [Kitasatospora aureofaciens]